MLKSSVDKWYKDRLEKEVKTQLKDERSIVEVCDLLNDYMTTYDIIKEDCWEGDVQLPGDYVTVDQALDLALAVSEYELEFAEGKNAENKHSAESCGEEELTADS